MTYGP